VKVLDLFSGIGGFSLGLERAGMETVAFCEIDPFCRRVLCEHWPDVPIFEDIRELDTKMVGPVDVVTGGFPCQPFSTASRGRRVAVDVWGHMLRVVNEILPTWVLAENVLGLGLDGVDRVVADLTDSGYTTTVTDIDVAPPHRSRGRFRYLFVAHSDRKGQPRLAFHEEMAGVPEISRRHWRDYTRAVGVDTRIPRRMDRYKRLQALGNAIPPQIPEIIGRAIMTAEHHD
jgi:DNA (cytosine-5)-methyltransferase 1